MARCHAAVRGRAGEGAPSPGSSGLLGAEWVLLGLRGPPQGVAPTMQVWASAEVWNGAPRPPGE